MIEKKIELAELWLTRAREVESLKELNVLMEDMMKHEHDYSSIVDACIAAALGAVGCMDKSPNGGLTGLQAGFIGMSFLTRWLHIEGPWRRVEYRDMLSPQYESDFEKTITPEAMEWLQVQAKEKLAAPGDVRPELTAHWVTLAEGKPPFGYTVK